ncbi:MAG: TPM domain-containing protein [Betaproteobacteria bacterium]|nr:MAG: TPM domain-containing protein [Betaproteobacteria bacterium]
MNLIRIAKHLVIPDWWAHRVFPKHVLERINAAVHESEKSHRGELCFVIEGDLELSALLGGITTRQRAEDVFAQMRVWDTEENSGVLIYVQLIDHCIEIVADRGINGKVDRSEWNTICETMQSAFHSGRYEQGSLEAIKAITALLQTHFPSGEENPDELPNRPIRL